MLPLLPVLSTLLFGSLMLLAWRHAQVQRRLSVVSAFVLLAIAIAMVARVADGSILVLNVGNWRPPFGIVFVVDRLSAVMVLMAGIVAATGTVFGLNCVDQRREAYGYHALLQFLLMGVCGAFLTGDFFNLFVWFEVMLLSSFVLLTLGGTRKQMEGGLKYVALNLLSSMMFLVSCGLLYGYAGTLNMADASLRLAEAGEPALTAGIGALMLVSFLLKAGAFPLFSWLPASYHTPPLAVTAIFGGLLTKVGVYALIRSTTLVFDPTRYGLQGLLWGVAVLTMVIGVLGAVAQMDVRRLLSFHIVSQIGYMILGLALFSVWGIAGALLHLIHNVFAKTGLFFVAGVVNDYRGEFNLKKLGGMAKSRPWLAFLFFVLAFGLVGVPPLSGFVSKYALVVAGLEARDGWAVAAILGVGTLTLFSMAKIWNESYWKPLAEDARPDLAPRHPERSIGPAVVMAVLVAVMGVLAGPTVAYAEAAAQQLLEPNDYIRAVLGGQG